MRKTAIRLLVAGSLLLASAAPTSAADRGTRPDANTALGVGARIRIVDFRFRPRVVEVARGSRVRWSNAGAVAHTTTALNGAWDSGSLAPGDSWSRVFRRAGTFRYGCTIHTDMTGKVVVT